MSTNKKIIKGSFIYGLGSISSKLIGFVLIPFYTKYLTTSDYGILGLIEVTSIILIAIFSMRLNAALFRWFWEEENIPKQKSIFFTSLIFLTLINLLSLSIISFFALDISNIIFQSGSYSYEIKLMALSIGISVIIELLKYHLRLLDKALLYTFSSIVRLVATLLLNIYFIVYLGKKIDGILEAQIYGQAFSLIVLVPYILKNLQFKLELKILKEMLNFSIPLIFAEISGILINITDRYCINYFLTTDDVGIYTLAFKISNVIRVFIYMPIYMAISPYLYKMINNENNKIFYSQIFTYMSALLLLTYAGLNLMGLDIVKVFISNKSYESSFVFIPLLSMSIIISIYKDISLLGLNIMKKTNYLAYIVTGIALLNFIFNLLLIPYFKIWGAIIATLLVRILFWWLIYRYSQKVYYIPYMIKIIVFMTILSLSLVYVDSLFEITNYFYKIMIIVLLIGVFVAVKFIEIEKIKKLYLDLKG